MESKDLGMHDSEAMLEDAAVNEVTLEIDTSRVDENTKSKALTDTVHDEDTNSLHLMTVNNSRKEGILERNQLKSGDSDINTENSSVNSRDNLMEICNWCWGNLVWVDWLLFDQLFEFLHLHTIVCKSIKYSVIILFVCVTSIFFTIFCIVSVKALLCVEKGLLADSENESTQLFMTFCILLIVLLMCSYSTTVAVSRQLELLFLVSYVPTSKSSLESAEKVANESDPEKRKFIQFSESMLRKLSHPTEELRYWKGAMTFFFVIMLVCYNNASSKWGFLFLVLFLATFTYIAIWLEPNQINHNRNTIVTVPLVWLWVHVVFGGLLTTLMFFTLGYSANDLEGDYNGVPIFGIIVLSFLGAATLINFIFVFGQVYVNPLFYLWKEYLDNCTNSALWHNRLLVFYLSLGVFAIVLGLVSFLSFMRRVHAPNENDWQSILAIISEIIFVMTNLTTCTIAIYMYEKDLFHETFAYFKLRPCCQPVVDESLRQPMMGSGAYFADVEKVKETVTTDGANIGDQERPRKFNFQGSFRNVHHSWNTITVSAGWIYTVSTFLVAMLAGLAIGEAQPTVWMQAIVYFFTGVLFVCPTHYPIQDHRNNRVYMFWKASQVILLVGSFFTIAISTALMQCWPAIFLLFVYSLGMMLLLFDMVLSCDDFSGDKQTIVQVQMVKDNLVIRFPVYDILAHAVFDKFQYYFGWCTAELRIIVALFPCGIIAEFTESPNVARHNSKVMTYHDRLFKAIYITAVLCNALAYFLSTYAETSQYFGDGGPTDVVSSLELDVSLEPQYSICSTDIYSLNAVDASYLVSLTYFQDPTNSAIDCGFYNSSNLQQCLQNYFTDSYIKAETNYTPYNWQVLGVHIPKSNNAKSKTAYYGIKSSSANLIVVGVRGSTIGRDWLENFNMYVEISMLQLSSLVIPTIYIWPVETIQFVVKALSYIHVLALLDEESNYYEPVIDYVTSLKSEYPTYNLLALGHSLGGATSGIVGARTKIRSFNIEPPGTVYSEPKFEIYDGNHDKLQPIHQTSLSIRRDNDPVPWVDMQGGIVQQLTCPVSTLSGMTYCHQIRPISCHLMANCDLMNASTFVHWGGGMIYCGL